MISETTIKGEIACLKFDEKCLRLGWVSSKPIIECDYDRVVDRKDGKLYRVQIKYAGSSLSKSEGVAAARLERGRIASKKKMYHNEVDAIVAYIPQVDKLCWVNQDEIRGQRSVSLRYGASKNKQSKRCRMAVDYEI